MSDRSFDIIGASVPSDAPTAKLGASGFWARAFSLVMLSGVGAAIAYAGYTAYRAARDAYVAPAILSPDNDVVVASKMKLAELADDEARANAELADIDAIVAADRRGIERLQGLQQKLENSLHWTSQITSAKASAGAAALRSLSAQRVVMEGMLVNQRRLAEKAKADVDSGIISRSDYAREQQAVDQLQLGLLENQRAAQDGQESLREAQLAQTAVQRPADAPLMPELMAREEQAIRVDLELVHLESEVSAKGAERTAVADRVAKLDELAADLKARPAFRAAEKSLDVAFVPYTQIEGVEGGADVYACFWSLFFCHQVGTVAELVPGEVVLPDPWGTPSRGQYAVLNLWSADAARRRTLRVRVTSASGGKGLLPNGS
jgi:hypothetical protein